jgi:hypothetical protein
VILYDIGCKGAESYLELTKEILSLFQENGLSFDLQPVLVEEVHSNSPEKGASLLTLS